MPTGASGAVPSETCGMAARPAHPLLTCGAHSDITQTQGRCRLPATSDLCEAIGVLPLWYAEWPEGFWSTRSHGLPTGPLARADTVEENHVAHIIGSGGTPLWFHHAVSRSTVRSPRLTFVLFHRSTALRPLRTSHVRRSAPCTTALRTSPGRSRAPGTVAISTARRHDRPRTGGAPR